MGTFILIFSVAIGFCLDYGFYCLKDFIESLKGGKDNADDSEIH